MYCPNEPHKPSSFYWKIFYPMMNYLRIILKQNKKPQTNMNKKPNKIPNLYGKPVRNSVVTNDGQHIWMRFITFTDIGWGRTSQIVLWGL